MIRRALLALGRVWLWLTEPAPQPSETELDLFDDRLWWRDE